MSDSQRPVQYIVMAPLLQSDLGKEQCVQWTGRLLNTIEVNKSGRVDDFKKILLCNIHLLASGHPRTIEKMVNYFNGKEDSDWD